MVMVIQFTKMHGLGNDFVVIDAISQAINFTPGQIKAIADRHFGIGCDQLLLVEKPTDKRAEFRYRIFNADGGEVEQCGNGARCFAMFVREKGLTDYRPHYGRPKAFAPAPRQEPNDVSPNRQSDPLVDAPQPSASRKYAC